MFSVGLHGPDVPLVFFCSGRLHAVHADTLLISLNLADFSMQFGVRSVGASPGCTDASAVGQNVDYRSTCVLLVE